MSVLGMIWFLTVVFSVIFPAVQLENPRIVGGDRAEDGQFPYQAALYITKTNGVKNFCGGSLVNSRWIVTAAHCLSQSTFVNIDEIVVVLGTSRLEPLDEGSQVFNITSYRNFVKIHPLYRSLSLANDLALLKLPSPVEFTSNVRPVRLPTSRSTLEFGVFFASGWGRVSDSSKTISNDLRFVEVSLMDHSKCMRSYLMFLVKSSNICVDTSEGYSTCQGDSGGPLVSKSLNELVGVTSFGSARGCESKSPAVFTKVSHYLDWIRKNIES
ncbi:hypothetical protein ACFFRR_010393 [Megaselia abdita]